MRNFKMIVAVMFAVMALMLMSTNVFAEKDYIQNITVDNNGVFTWDEYEGAVRYSLSLYGRESDTDDGTDEYYKTVKEPSVDAKTWIWQSNLPSGKYRIGITAEDSNGNSISKYSLSNTDRYGNCNYIYSNENGRLSKPTNLHFDGQYIRWDAVENATQYVMFVNRYTKTNVRTYWFTGKNTQTNYYDLQREVMTSDTSEMCYFFNDDYSYDFTIKAIDDTHKYSESLISDVSEKFHGVAPYAPTILSQPESQIVTVGEPLSFTVRNLYSGNYEWRLYDFTTKETEELSNYETQKYIGSSSGNLCRLTITNPDDKLAGKGIYCRVWNDKGEKTTDIAIFKFLCTVSFDKNGGNGDNFNLQDKIYSGDEVQLPECSFSAPERKNFAGWDINDTIYAEDDSVKIYKDTTAYAQWEYIKPVITTNTPDTYECEQGDTITLHVAAENAESYEWRICEHGDGQDWGFGRFHASGVNTDTLTLTAEIDIYNMDIWCVLRNGDKFTESNITSIVLTDADEVVWIDELSDETVNVGGTAVFEGRAVFADDGYDWRFFLKDKEVSISDLKKYCTVYQPSERKIVFINVPLSLNGLELTLIATNDSTGSTQSSATLNVFGSIDLENGNNVIRRNVYYGNSVTLWFDDLDAQEGVTYTVIYTTPSGTKTSWTNGSPDENWLILNPKYEPYKTMLQAGNTLEIRAEGIDYNKGGQASTDTAILTVVYKPGDIDLNGTINQADAALYLKYLSGTKTFSTTQFEIADVNYDGYKDMRDVVAIMKIADKA